MNNQPPNEPPQTKWHRILGKLFELTYAPLGVTVSVDFPLLSEPPRGDILLIRRQTERWTDEQRAFLPDGIRTAEQPYLLIEFKYSESVNVQVLGKTLGYWRIYQERQNLTDEQIACFVLSSKTPQSRFLQRHGYQPAEVEGVYRSQTPILAPMPIIALNQLSNQMHNALVKCFASQYRQRESAFDIVRQNWHTIPQRLWYFMSGLYRTTDMKGDDLMSIPPMTEDDVLRAGEEFRQIMLKVSTIDERLYGLNPEDIITRLKPEDIITRLSPEDIITRLSPEDIITRLKPEDIAARLPIGERTTPLKTGEALSEFESFVTRKSYLDGILQSLRLRFKLPAEQLATFQAQLQQVALADLEPLSEVAILADDVSEFRARLAEVLPDEQLS